MTKLKDFLFGLYIAITGNRDKKRFMLQLMKECEKHDEYMDFLSSQSPLKEDSTWYLQELFEYWKCGGVISNKIENDMCHVQKMCQ